MNLIEAIKSGKMFKRSDWREYLEVDLANTNDFVPLTPEDILAEDWEVEEIIIPVTENTFDLAWQRAVNSYPPSGPWLDAFMPILKKELGL